MSDSRDRKEYCDARDQKKVVEKLTACDNNCVTDKERVECYAKVVENNGCISS